RPAVRAGLAPGVGPAGPAAGGALARPPRRPFHAADVASAGGRAPPSPRGGGPKKVSPDAGHRSHPIALMDVVTPAYRGAFAIAQVLPGSVIDVLAPGVAGLAALRPGDQRAMVERHQRRVDPGLGGAE